MSITKLTGLGGGEADSADAPNHPRGLSTEAEVGCEATRRRVRRGNPASAKARSFVLMKVDVRRM